MIPLTFTTTAMPRPEILERTYASFHDRLRSCDFSRSTLLLNIDPFPDDTAEGPRARCVTIAEKYFGTVHVNMPSVSNFALALKWLWESTEANHLFHLEDDWELLEDIDVSLLLACNGPSVPEHVVLRAWTWRDYPFCLSPGLLRRRLFKSCALNLTGASNPELTLRNALANTCYSPTVFPVERRRVILRDLGRPWMRRAQYVRGGGGFVRWSKKTEVNRFVDDRLADQTRELV